MKSFFALLGQGRESVKNLLVLRGAKRRRAGADEDEAVPARKKRMGRPPLDLKKEEKQQRRREQIRQGVKRHRERQKVTKAANAPPPPTEEEKKAKAEAAKERKRQKRKQRIKDRKAEAGIEPGAKTLKTMEGTQHFGQLRADFEDPEFMKMAPSLKKNKDLSWEEKRNLYENEFPQNKSEYKTNPVKKGFLYYNLLQDIRDEKVEVLNWRNNQILRLRIQNADGKGYTEVLAGHVPKAHQQFLDNALEVSQQSFEYKEGSCRKDVGDEGEMKSIGAKYLHQYKENDWFGMYQLAKKHQGFRKKAARTLVSYHDFLEDFVKRSILEEMEYGENTRGVSNASCAEAVKEKTGGSKNVPPVRDFIDLMGGKHLYNLITSRNLNNTVHLDTLDESVCCTTWVFDRKNTLGEDSIVAHFVLPNTYINGKPVAIKIHHGMFIIWDGRKVWHNTVISKKADDNNIYGLYTAANKGLKLPK